MEEVKGNIGERELKSGMTVNRIEKVKRGTINMKEQGTLERTGGWR